MNLDDIREGIVHGMEQEAVFSEVCVSGIVTHEIAMYFNFHAPDDADAELLEQVSRHALFGVRDSQVPFHSFTIAETARGVVHGLVCAGQDVSYVAHPVLKGMKNALAAVEQWHPEHESAVRQGIAQALADLGLRALEEDSALELPRYFRNEAMAFGEVG